MAKIYYYKWKKLHRYVAKSNSVQTSEQYMVQTNCSELFGNQKKQNKIEWNESIAVCTQTQMQIIKYAYIMT